MAERRYYGLLAPRYPNSAFKLNFFCERSGDLLPLVMGVTGHSKVSAGSNEGMSDATPVHRQASGQLESRMGAGLQS